MFFCADNYRTKKGDPPGKKNKMRTIVIGDTHGFSEELRRLLAQINPASGDTIIPLGDFWDRGPDSRGVVDEFLALQGSGIQVDGVLGNHDLNWMYAFDFGHQGAPKRVNCRDFIPEGFFRGQDKEIDVWRNSRNGREETCQSYGWESNWAEFLRSPPEIPAEHLAFLKSLRTHELLDFDERGKFLLVHSPLSQYALAAATLEECLERSLAVEAWRMLNELGTLEVQPGFSDGIVVHGHIPWKFVPNTGDFANLPAVVNGRLNIDGGVISRTGQLVAVELPSQQFFTQPRVTGV
jgi:serine/threonine protein phosphatase 1